MFETAFLKLRRPGEEPGFVQLREADHRVGLVEVGAALVHEGDLLAAHLAAGKDDPVHRAVGGQRLRAGFGRVDRVRRPALGPHQLFHRQALAAVAVVELVLAEDLGEGVDVVGGGRRRAPGVVAAVAELDVEADAGEGGAAGVDPGAVQVLLHQDLRDVVADLGTHHRDRMAARRVLGRDQLPVRGVRGRFTQACAGAAPPMPPAAGGCRSSRRSRSRFPRTRAAVRQRQPLLGEGAARLIGEAARRSSSALRGRS